MTRKRAPKKAARPKPVKPFNNGTMTAPAFWWMINKALRRKSMQWKPIATARNRNRRASKSANKRLKFEYQCESCAKWYPGTAVAVHHTIPVGTLACADDLPGFVLRLFCEADKLKLLCTKCHDAEHVELRKTSEVY